MAERARVSAIGLSQWIEEQLAPNTLDDSATALRVRRFDSLIMDTSVIFDVREENVRRELQQATLLRAIYSRRQLYELMVDFWSDHFNIYTLKTGCAWHKTIDDREVIRPHALGKFRDLLWASLHSPAMLVYLDNQDNKKNGPNENYARELMELHTLGVNAGYTQQDVHEVARCLTGLTVSRPPYLGKFKFEAALHDGGDKLVLGQKIKGGEGELEQLTDIILKHPAIPVFISRKLVRRFVADDPPPELVNEAANTFRRTDGDIKAVLSTILHSAEIQNPTLKLKRPFNYMVGALRQLNAETDANPALVEMLGRMGQPLFQFPTPDGYPDTSSAWVGNLITRWHFALSLATDSLPGTKIDLARLTKEAELTNNPTLDNAISRLSSLLLGKELPAQDQTALVGLWGNTLDETGLRAALATLLSSPYYQWR